MSDLATGAAFPDILRVDARAAFAVGGLTAGTVFAGRYRIVRLVASGGMSAVYEVVDTRTERRRALKVLLATLLGDPEAKRRFELEARITSSVDSPHVAEVLDSGIDDALGVPYLVTALLEGSDLGALLRSKGKLEPGEVLGIVAQITKGLAATHAKGIVHRDIKPENVLVCRSAETFDRVVIVDFGVAKSLERAGGNTTRSILGTPLYVAPEQIQFKREEVSPAADLYALGMVVYALLVGEPYYAPEEEASDGTMQFFLDVVAGAPEAASARARRRREVDLPPAFDAWFARAVAVSPRDRFPDARTLDEALRVVFDGTPAATAIALPPVAKTLVDEPVALPHATDPGSPTPALTSARTISSTRGRSGLRVALWVAGSVALVALAASWWRGAASNGDRPASPPAETSHASARPEVATASASAPVVRPASSPVEPSTTAPLPSAPAPSASTPKRAGTLPPARTPPPAPPPSRADAPAPKYVPPLIER